MIQVNHSKSYLTLTAVRLDQKRRGNTDSGCCLPRALSLWYVQSCSKASTSTLHPPVQDSHATSKINEIWSIPLRSTHDAHCHRLHGEAGRCPGEAIPGLSALSCGASLLDCTITARAWRTLWRSCSRLAGARKRGSAGHRRVRLVVLCRSSSYLFSGTHRSMPRRSKIAERSLDEPLFGFKPQYKFFAQPCPCHDCCLKYRPPCISPASSRHGLVCLLLVHMQYSYGWGKNKRSRRLCEHVPKISLD